jgi:hypothetical protein
MSKPFLKFHGINPKTRQNMVFVDDTQEQIRSIINKNKIDNNAHNAQMAQDAISDLVAELGTPVIPKEVYDKMPDFLKRACGVFTNIRERDMFLTGALVILGGCFNNVSGVYDGRTVYTNLFAFIVAGAGNGKGVLIFAKKLGQALHKAIKEAHLNGTNTSAAHKRRTLYMPANISSAAIIKMLIDNGGSGIMCETEADTLTDTLKQDWGGYSSLMRGSFQHEAVTYCRKMNDELIEIENPQLSVVLSGTHDQFRKLISSIENGLFSRFIFYSFNDPRVWKDVSPIGKPNLTNHFDCLSAEVVGMVDKVKTTPITFEMTQEQWEALNIGFKQRLELTQYDDDDDAGGSVYRLGLITFRMAMLFTVIRAVEASNTEVNIGTIICSDEDFNSAMILSGVYLEHALHMMDTLPKSAPLDPIIARFYAELPNEFSNADAVRIGARMGFKKRTVGRYLPILIDKKKLEKIKHGSYRKI